jgi:non-ribosomal peptide synthetase component F
MFTVDVPLHVARLVDAIGLRYGTTAFMTLLAAFQVLLAHRTGRTDIAVGLPAAGREAPETEDLIGFFLNTLVLRTDLSGGPSFVEVLHRVRETVLTALMHNDVPFEDVVAAARPGRDPARNPLFEVMFQVMHTSGPPGTLGGAAVEPLPTTATAAKFDLVFTVQRTAGGDLRCMLEYASGLFDRTTMQRLAEDYAALLERLAGAPRVRAVQPAPMLGTPTTPAASTTGPATAPAPPAGPVEQAIAGIWSALLDVDDIAAADDFFDLGGHSLLATRVRAALRRTFAVELPLQVLFEATTVAELAAAVTASVRADVGRMSASQVQGVLLRAAPKGIR